MTLWALDGIAPVVHPTAWVHPDATVIGRVELGPEVSIWPQAVLRGDYGDIRIGARTSIQDGTVLHATAEHPTVIGADCVVGHLAHLEGCTVGNRALIGSNSVVLNRVVVGEGALVGAGALVAEDTVVPPDSRALGVPARVRPGGAPAAWVDDAVARYVQNARRYRAGLTRVEEAAG